MVLGRYFCPCRSENRAGRCSACAVSGAACATCGQHNCFRSAWTNQSLTEKTYSKIRYSRLFTSPWREHRSSSWDMSVDPLVSTLAGFCLSTQEQALWGRAGCALATGACPGRWPSRVSDRAALGLAARRCLRAQQQPWLWKKEKMWPNCCGNCPCRGN